MSVEHLHACTLLTVQVFVTEMQTISLVYKSTRRASKPPERVADHGRRLRARPGPHRPFIRFQPGIRRSSAGRSAAPSRCSSSLPSGENLAPTTNSAPCYSRFQTILAAACSLFSRCTVRTDCLSVMLPGWVERRVHILFIWLDDFTSASPFPLLRSLYPC